MNLANCRELLGDLAAAYELFEAVASAATRRGQDARAEFAAGRAAALAARLGWLTIAVPESVLEHVVVRTDGRRVPREKVGQRLPAVPGLHEVVVIGAGGKRWRERVEIPAASTHRTLTVPPEIWGAGAASSLAIRRAAEEPTTETQATAARRDTAEAAETSPGISSTDAWALVMAGVGLGATGAATYFTLRAVALEQEAEVGCDGAVCTERSAYDARRAAHASGTAATAATALGAGAVVAALSLWLWPESKGSPGHSAYLPTPTIGPHAVQVSWKGTF